MDTKTKTVFTGIAILCLCGLYILCKLLGIEIPFAATLNLILGS